MTEKRENGKKTGSRLGRFLSLTGTVLILAVIALCLLLILPGAFGFSMYDVISGSMEPEMPVGSLIYVEKGAPEDVKEGDVIAFYGTLGDSGVITHRVTENQAVSGRFRTKGDANEEEDPLPVSYDAYIGRVVFSVPHLGRWLAYLTSRYGKIAAGCVILLGTVLNLAGFRLGREG